MTATTRSVDGGRLKTLAEKANREHSQARRAAGQAVKHAVEAGGLLQKAKEEVGHGNFIKWAEENFEGSERVARKYMSLARAADQKRIDLDEVSSLAEAERLLREQDAPEWEPEEPDEEYDFRNTNWESDESGAESEPAPQPQRSARKPARKLDLQTSALRAMQRFIEEVPGQEKDRIQAMRERLDMWESALLAPVSEEG